MINISVIGGKGRMGERIINAINNDIDVKLSGVIVSKNSPFIDTAVSNSNIKITEKIEKTIHDTDVYIDFSSSEATLNNMTKIAESGKALVIGTTGFSDQEKKQIEKASLKIPIVFSPNMSIGVNVFFALLKEAGSFLKEYDTEIIELHHNKKKDAPSGTAIKAAEYIAGITGKSEDKWIFGRHGISGERSNDEIGIHAVRLGDVIGEHTVIFAGNNERIEITHKAHTRDNFAKGAVIAAKWIKGKPNGLYDMFDVLNLKK